MITRLRVVPAVGGGRIVAGVQYADVLIPIQTRRIVRTILEDAGAMVATTSSADQTRAVLSCARPDVLIADIGLPREDGYSLIRSVRALAPDKSAGVPAIALSAHVRPEDVEAAIASGFHMHLAKPIDPSKLLSAVAATLLHHEHAG